MKIIEVNAGPDTSVWPGLRCAVVRCGRCPGRCRGCPVASCRDSNFAWPIDLACSYLMALEELSRIDGIVQMCPGRYVLSRAVHLAAHSPLLTVACPRTGDMALENFGDPDDVFIRVFVPMAVESTEAWVDPDGGQSLIPAMSTLQTLNSIRELGAREPQLVSGHIELWTEVSPDYGTVESLARLRGMLKEVGLRDVEAEGAFTGVPWILTAAPGTGPESDFIREAVSVTGAELRTVNTEEADNGIR